jgi:uncharacterized hydrophobic protein (TIGR00271 family)
MSNTLPPGAANRGPTAAGLHVLRSLRYQIGAALGVSAQSRENAVASMLTKPPEDTPAYWFQLLMATGMATLGLVLGSSAVVIGAMLVAPLMTPIIELAMSQVVGGSVLMLRSLIRIGASMAAVILVSMLFTLALPFDEANAEILARTSPTALDLCIAVFCALTAAFTTARTTSGAVSTAAGTAIGISLVPPLCVVGYGLGEGDGRIATGALLLFTANFSAIQLFAALFFLAVGFHALPPEEMQRAELTTRRPGRLALKVAETIDRGLRGRHSVMWRLGVPLLFFAAVSAPLTTALRHVAWQVRTRTALNAIASNDIALREAINLTSTIDPEALTVRATIVGDETTARDLEQRVTTQLAAAAGVVPRVVVRAVPPGSSLEKVERAVGRRSASPEPVLTGRTAAAFLAERLAAIIDSRWPAEGVGRPVGRRAAVRADGQIEVLVAHWGPPLGLAAERLLEQALSADVGTLVDVVPSDLPTEPLTERVRDALAWYEAALPAIEKTGAAAGVFVCLDIPPASAVGADRTARWVRAQVQSRVASFDPAHVAIREARQWSLRLSAEPCAQP